MSPNATLYIALVLYAAGTLVALVSLFARDVRMQHGGLGMMIAGWISHTIWIGTICTMTGHPPLTNLPEIASFVAWTVFLVELILFLRYRVQAAAFFVYPLVLILLTLTAVVREPFAKMDPALRNGLFTTHVFLSTIGVAALLVGLAFTILAWFQDRSLKSKRRGKLWEWIPSLNVCRILGYRMLAVGFAMLASSRASVAPDRHLLAPEHSRTKRPARTTECARTRERCRLSDCVCAAAWRRSAAPCWSHAAGARRPSSPPRRPWRPRSPARPPRPAGACSIGPSSA